jgi:hypothetical protein
MKLAKSLIAVAATLALSGAALADITIGVSLSLTGPGSGLGIPMQNQFKLFPTTIAGEKVNLILMDDAPPWACRPAKTSLYSACPSPTPSWALLLWST